ncbi:MAG: HAD-IA family hydrolase [Gammaproteobacteria bacterium]|nr:HAD-IA family hydrolase [Gammaproteobacteria bacterium]MCP5199429.1 HAD-IA family hydrolase [Gammaproteobacteria bacterium]
MVIKAILLDLDDTLWDPRPAFVRAERAQYAWLQARAPDLTARYSVETMREHRRALAAQRPEIAHDFTRLREAALRELLTEVGCPSHWAEEGVAVFVDERSRVDLFPDALPTLAELARNHTLVALTNGNADLAIAGVAEHFEACISPAEAGVRKPDPAMFRAALDVAGVAAAAAIHVGDQPLYDVEGARRAELAAVWVNRDGMTWPAELAPAAAEIASLAELPALIQRLNRG